MVSSRAGRRSVLARCGSGLRGRLHEPRRGRDRDEPPPVRYGGRRVRLPDRGSGERGGGSGDHSGAAQDGGEPMGCEGGQVVRCDGGGEGVMSHLAKAVAVSYTHLTLPTSDLV